MRKTIKEMIESKNDDLGIIFCPPLSDYPVKPDDHSPSTLEECSECHRQMWLSEKKKEVIRLMDHISRDHIMICYECMFRMVVEHKDFFCNVEEINQINL